MKPNTLESFLYFVKERESIRVKKEELRLPPPWTDDPLLQKYRFCNIRRKDDRVSRWIIQHLYTPNADYVNLWLMACIARWVNWPPMLQQMIDHDAWEQEDLSQDWFEALGDDIDDRVRNGEKAWTGAYMITARTLPKGVGKGRWIAMSTLKPLYDRKDEFERFFAKPEVSVREAAKLFTGAYNHGPFMAGQIVADWTYTRLLDRATDLLSWAPIGPGSVRGLNRLCGRPLDKTIKEDQFLEELITTHELIQRELGMMNLTLHDIQSTHCEHDKFCRLLEGGRVRAGYTPETRFEI